MFQHVQIDGDANIWRYYRSPGDERDMPTRPSHAIMSAGYQSLLFQVVSDTIRLYCGLEGTITAGAIIDLYRRFLLWKEDLPPALKTASGMNEEALPHVIYLQYIFPLSYENCRTDSTSPVSNSKPHLSSSSSRWPRAINSRDQISVRFETSLGTTPIRAWSTFNIRIDCTLLAFKCPSLAFAVCILRMHIYTIL